MQAHRLGAADVSPVLAARYGPIDLRVRFADLDARLHHRGHRLSEITGGADAGYRRYRLTSSRATIIVTLTAWDGRLDAGDVWAIDGPHALAHP